MKSRDYIEEEYCYNCEEDTMHTGYDSGHERDSSGDWRWCHVCKWYYSGHNGEYTEPDEEDLEYRARVVEDYNKLQQYRKKFGFV